MFIYIYTYNFFLGNIYPYFYIHIFLFCNITVWYKKNNNIIMKIQKIIKRIIFILFLLQKIKF